jgi:hypothetical protein
MSNHMAGVADDMQEQKGLRLNFEILENNQSDRRKIKAIPIVSI